jgi:two-component system, OmpR family, alkaline phosphatase synthesis response regulator PhoP
MKPTVLVVEDDRVVADFLKLILEGAGYAVLTADNGRSAVETARSKKPALMVLDLMLPEIHGIGVCQTIKSDPATQGIKVFIISAKNFPADHKQAHQAGADLFMGKPLAPAKFLAAVEELLGDRSGK